MSPLTLAILLLVDGLSKAITSVHALPPQQSETREFITLDGLWNFVKAGQDTPDQGFDEKWFAKSLRKEKSCIKIPVPSSYNDVTQDRSLRDHVGWVWYDRDFFGPASWNHDVSRQVYLRFESVHYYARVWLNGAFIMNHEGGHLPFQFDVSKTLRFAAPNRITVAVNNTLTPFTLPCGRVVRPDDPERYPPGYFHQELVFDFFNYAGIHRSVYLTAVPRSYISDVSVVAAWDSSKATVAFFVDVKRDQAPARDDLSCTVKILEEAETAPVAEVKCDTNVTLTDPRLWWPVGMSETVGALYIAEVTIKLNQKVLDVYRQKFGIRSVEVRPDGFFINRERFYFRGFGKHEDFHIVGRGFSLPVMVKDFNLMEWTGANSVRTSHYPYAQEFLDYADEHGIVVIAESPAVGLHAFPNRTLNHHLDVMKSMIQRDKNHPSIVMWSVANEPKSYDPASEEYFRAVISYTRQLDPSKRPVTFVIGGSNATLDKAAHLVDVLCINHYFGWYTDPGQLILIQRQLIYDLTQWLSRFKKPIIVTEYGADTVSGFHASPSAMFTEEYQVELMEEYHSAFDLLRNSGILTGEMVWNFADFMTDQQVNRVVGNRKGIFTRDRQPKMAAHTIRRRYKNMDSLPKSDVNASFKTHVYSKDFLVVET